MKFLHSEIVLKELIIVNQHQTLVKFLCHELIYNWLEVRRGNPSG